RPVRRQIRDPRHISVDLERALRRGVDSRNHRQPVRQRQRAPEAQVLVIDEELKRLRISHHNPRSNSGTISQRIDSSSSASISTGTPEPGGMGRGSHGFTDPDRSVVPFRIAVATRGSVSTTNVCPAVRSGSPIVPPSTVTVTPDAGPVTVHTGHASTSPGFSITASPVEVELEMKNGGAPPSNSLNSNPSSGLPSHSRSTGSPRQNGSSAIKFTGYVAQPLNAGS